MHIHLCFSEHVATLRRTRGTCPHSRCAGPVPMSNVRLRLQHVPAGARRRPLPTHRSGCDAPSRRGFVSASPTAGCVERLLVSSSFSCASSLEKRLARLFSSLNWNDYEVLIYSRQVSPVRRLTCECPLRFCGSSFSFAQWCSLNHERFFALMMRNLSVLCTFSCIFFGGQVLSFLLAMYLELEFLGPGASAC